MENQDILEPISRYKISKIKYQKMVATLKRVAFILDSETFCTSKVVKGNIVAEVKDLVNNMMEVIEDDKTD